MIANSIDAYIGIAKNLAVKGNRSSNERMKLRNLLQCSAVADGARLSRELENLRKREAKHQLQLNFAAPWQ